MEKMFNLAEEINNVKEYAEVVENEFFDYLIRYKINPVKEKENEFVKGYFELHEISNVRADNCKSGEDISALTNIISELRKYTNYQGRDVIEKYNITSEIEVMREVNSSTLAVLTKYLIKHKIDDNSNHPIQILTDMICDLNDSLITGDYTMNELILLQEKFKFAREYIQEVIKKDE